MLNDKHIADLRKSGLNDEYIAKMKVFSADETELRNLLKFECYGGGLVFPYPIFEEYYRAKSDNPIVTPDGKTKSKYLAQQGPPNHFYILTEVESIKSDASKPLIITEGEKKAAKACQEGFPTLGLGGVSSWQTKKTDSKVIADFDLINWINRLVYLIFDSDLSRNKDVRMAMDRLKKYLESRGARVICKFLPEDGNEKIGLDDFLVAKGNDALRKLLELKVILPDVSRSHDIDRLVKINSRPPIYEVYVGGKILKMTGAETLSFESFQLKAWEELNEVVEFEKPSVNWMPYIRAISKNGAFHEEEAPHGSSNTDPIVSAIVKSLKKTIKIVEDYKSGFVLEKDGALWIRGVDLTSNVMKAVKTAKPNEIYLLAHNELKGKKSGVRIRPGPGGVISSWKFDKSIVDGNQYVDDSEEDSGVVEEKKGVTDDF